MIVAPKIGKQQLVWVGFVAAVLVAYLFYPWAIQREPLVFNSPDETANYFFTRQWSGGNGLVAFEPLNDVAQGNIHPRSINASGISLGPTSFVGLPILFGSVALFAGPAAIPYMTGVLTVLALLGLFGIWRRFFDSTTAAAAAVLTAIHPAIWYFASRGLYHNMLFVDLVILSVWSFMKWQDQTRSQDVSRPATKDNLSSSSTFVGLESVEWFVVSAILFLLALLTRTSEALWLLPMAAGVAMTQRGRLDRRHFIALVGVVLVALVTWSAFRTAWPQSITGLVGYHVVNGAGSSSIARLWHVVSSALFPFGFHPARIIENTFSYGLHLFWPYTLLGLFGLVVWFWRGKHRHLVLNRPKYYIQAAGFVSVVLFVYYGSAMISDSVGLSAFSIGNSFARYWLPIYIVWIPFVALGVRELAMLLTKRHVQTLSSIIVLVILGWSFWVVFFSPAEGLVHVADRLATYRAVRQATLQATESDAVIVSDQSDKVFFPDRRVITPGDRPFETYPSVMRVLPQLSDTVPVYLYLLHAPDQELLHLLTDSHLALGRVFSLPDGGRLYRLIHL